MRNKEKILELLRAVELGSQVCFLDSTFHAADDHVAFGCLRTGARNSMCCIRLVFATHSSMGFLTVERGLVLLSDLRGRERLDLTCETLFSADHRMSSYDRGCASPLIILGPCLHFHFDTSFCYEVIWRLEIRARMWNSLCTISLKIIS